MEAFDTARLHVRPIAERDQALYCGLYTDPLVMRFIAPVLSLDVAQRSFGVAMRQQARHPQRWILTERFSGNDVGMVALVGEGDGPEIGVMVVAGRHGLGYGYESMAGLVHHAFAHGSLTSITARQSIVDNPTVVRMMTKLRFRALPPSPERPDGGDWLLHRREWRNPGPRPPVAGGDGGH